MIAGRGIAREWGIDREKIQQRREDDKERRDKLEYKQQEREDGRHDRR